MSIAKYKVPNKLEDIGTLFFEKVGEYEQTRLLLFKIDGIVCWICFPAFCPCAALCVSSVSAPSDDEAQESDCRRKGKQSLLFNKYSNLERAAEKPVNDLEPLQ
jgi:hypothetical protein